MKLLKEVSIIGTGALGNTLARALDARNFILTGLYNRSEKLLQPLVKDIKPARYGSFPEAPSEIGAVCFITVPDGEIEKVARRLSTLSGDFAGKIIVHCSGSKTSDALSLLQQKGASVASFHPMQTFTAASTAEFFSGIYFDIEGDKQAVSFLKHLAHLFESHCIEIDPEAKPYLHASAVMASNYLVALLDSASSIAQMGGIAEREARSALLPLIKQSLQNSSDSHSLTEALSGPIARGDVSTVRAHIHLLEPNAGMVALYKQLGLQALKLARKGNSISDEQHQALLKLLQQ